MCLEIQSAGKNDSLAEAVSVEYIIQQGYIGTSSGEANIVWGLKFSLTLKMDSTGEWFKMFRQRMQIDRNLCTLLRKTALLASYWQFMLNSYLFLLCSFHYQEPYLPLQTRSSYPMKKYRLEDLSGMRMHVTDFLGNFKMSPGR